MSIKKDFYKLDKKTFDLKLQTIKQDSNTFILFKNTTHPYFYYETPEINKKVLDLNKKIWEFDLVYKSFSLFGQGQLLQSFLINEINSTNEIENIHSTRHDIFYILNNNDVNTDSKLLTITRSYLYLLTNGTRTIKTPNDIRNLYDYVFKDVIDKKDIPDGKYFRKDKVHVSDGVKNVHEGFYPEKIINSTMDEFLKLYNSNKETCIKNIISHFMIETIHPYYDGNGRLGRLLFTNQLLKDTNSRSSFLISTAFNSNKHKYYKAFKEGRDVHQFGCINEYIEIILNILISHFDLEINNMKTYLSKIEVNPSISLSKSEKIVYNLLIEATYLSDYGVSINELIKYSKLSRRTIMYIMNKFKENKYLLDTKIGKTTYHKIIIS